MSGYAGQFFHATWLTLELALLALGCGLLLGIGGALAKLSTHAWIRIPVVLLTSLLRGLPELLILFFVYFGGTILFAQVLKINVSVSSFAAGTVALALLFAAYATETLRGAYLAIPIGQFEAGYALGLTKGQVFKRVILPQLWRHALPGLGNLWFVLLKDTALVSLIGMDDIMWVAQKASAYTLKPFSFYLIAAMIYLLLTSVSLGGQKLIERRLQWT